MLIVMRDHATREEIDHVVALLKEAGAEAHLSRGEVKTIIGVIGDREVMYSLELEGLPGVEQVVRVLKPYKLVSRDFQPEDTVVCVGSAAIGGSSFAVIAGPCSVETEEQVLKTARAVKVAGATILRGGAFKPRTSPYAFQGLGVEGLRLLRAAADDVGLPMVTEVLDVRDAETVAEYADMLQVGARNMQNFMMLEELGRLRKPVLLKRGLSATIEEVLSAAEYVLKGGNRDVVLCERGIRTFETYTRNTLDLAAVSALKTLTHLPVIADPSHGTGRRDLVRPMCRAALAAGADGVMVEVHIDPEHARCDGPQSLTPEMFADLVAELRPLASIVGRSVGTEA
ncbi:3-deoxy-7-phosphoheptulonate synthase [Coriobacteriia bacterium Es71-Z0120]|uniref:3-deoxy-7-phosphoheptulonate synthase n=1 Tax=Parvivirga hydrogeniphila TaxID=2939460 RepID=UPI002260F232|nr:3-deoxy-7-phosphoheptulonate synthase [Parvivirga hydrogeniphila]MCL4079052.1 3-deoxy-7-phosphoheptulonate synthase [Parvivirga hydrogeniphila]